MMKTDFEIIKGVVTLENYIYAIGGSNREIDGSNDEVDGWTYERYLKTVERYDVLNDKLEVVASMKYKRECPKAVVFDKKIYVFGKSFLMFKILNQFFYDVYNNLHNCDASLLIVSGGYNAKSPFVKIVECYDEETNEWKEVARTEKYFSQVIVSYQPCVPDICKNIPF